MLRITGKDEETIVGGEKVLAFVPFPLPPSAPPLSITSPLADRLQMAERALARLNLAAAMVPSIDWFLYAFVRKEAVITSQIEGTQATLVDLFAFEATPDKPADAEIEEVCNYLDALQYVRAELAAESGLPLSMRLLNEAHRRLMTGVRGANKQPGEIRRGQNWIGGSRPGNAAFVPPPPQLVMGLLSDLERYVHADDDLHPLVRAAIVHVQFETIHPYLDGNGRIGRLLIGILLEHWGLLQAPLLYLSLFFKRHQAEYYRRLGEVRLSGDWEGWVDFFLDGVSTIAEEAVVAAQAIHDLMVKDRMRVLADANASVAALRLLERLHRHPIVSIALVSTLLKTTKPTATRAIEMLASAGVLVESTGRRRDRMFAYQGYIDILSAGTEIIR